MYWILFIHFHSFLQACFFYTIHTLLTIIHFIIHYLYNSGVYLIFLSYETSTQSFLLEDPTIYFLDPSPKRKEYVNVLIHFIMHYLYTIHTLFTIIRFIIHYSYTSIHSYKHVFSTLFIHYSLLYTLS